MLTQNPSRTISLSEYNPSWPKIFEIEARKIKESLGNYCLEVHHIGSTSVKGLLAKPIIDIILVVTDVSAQLDGKLGSAGYKYKGEYNLPLRRMYGKKEEATEIYLHAHGHGSPEIDLNILFRDYLKTHPQSRDEYALLKRTILDEDASHKTVSSGITTYNLGKNDFIQKTLKDAGFQGLCPRFCTQDTEWNFYRDIRNTFAQEKDIGQAEPGNPDQKHLVLYKGTDMVGAANLVLKTPDAFLGFSGYKEDPSYRIYLLDFIEKWLQKNEARFLTATGTLSDASFYESRGYKTIQALPTMAFFKEISEPLRSNF